MAVQYIGSTDKPVDSIILSTSRGNARLIRASVLRPDEKVFALLATAHLVDGEHLETLSEKIKKFVIDKKISKHEILRMNQVIRVTIVYKRNKKAFVFNKEYSHLIVDSFIRFFNYDKIIKSSFMIFKRNALGVSTKMKIHG